MLYDICVSWFGAVWGAAVYAAVIMGSFYGLKALAIHTFFGK